MVVPSNGLHFYIQTGHPLLSSLISLLMPVLYSMFPTRFCPRTISILHIYITYKIYYIPISMRFYHIYADDTQLYSFLPLSTPDNSQLITCASSIKYWLFSNNLLLNTSKTSLLNIHTNSPPFISFTLTIVLFHLTVQSSILVSFSTLIYLFHIAKFLKLLIIINLESDVSVNILLIPYVLSLLIHL